VDVVVIDDLSTGVRSRVPADVPFVQANVANHDAVLAALRDHGVRGVLHLAARKAVPESVADPGLYYRENVVAFEALLAAMGAGGVRAMVHSSSAAVIGTPTQDKVDEDADTRPENPYGRTKLICEWMLEDLARAGGIDFLNLRYFNVAGAGSPELGDTGEFNLIPMVFRALTEGRAPQVFGADYPTRDGSCIRDFVHVADVADAHVAAVRHLEAARSGGQAMARTYNVGRGEGVTVKEVMEAVRAVTGQNFTPELAPRRPGDPAQVVGVVDRIAEDLGWRAGADLTDMVRSAWEGWRHRAEASA
jgi:UDP-glucose 4-epimerase